MVGALTLEEKAALTSGEDHTLHTVGQHLARPPKELKAFGKVALDPGESAVVEFVLDDRAFAYWDPGQDDWNEVQAFVPEMFNFLSPPAPRRERGWQVDAGSYEILIGRSSDDLARRCTISVPDAASGS